MHNTLIRRFSFIPRQSGINLDRQLKKLNLSFGQFLYIMCICENAGLSQENLSSRLKIDKGSVARTVKQLEADGYITRSVSPTTGASSKSSHRASHAPIRADCRISRDWKKC
jgi:DNA-binding MarR family transcriptional regulator